jgi:hypothetical protein
MALKFNEELADALKSFYADISSDGTKSKTFSARPTETVTKYLNNKGVTIPDPATFHAHAIRVGGPLPVEPRRATIERYIYVFRKSGLFEFKIVPADPTGNDEFMLNPSGACECCNCCVCEV